LVQGGGDSFNLCGDEFAVFAGGESSKFGGGYVGEVCGEVFAVGEWGRRSTDGCRFGRGERSFFGGAWVFGSMGICRDFKLNAVPFYCSKIIVQKLLL
jgi:hypothetical protein